MTITTKHGSRVKIIGKAKPFNGHKRVWIEYLRDGLIATILVDYLIPQKEVRKAIRELGK